jgi:hypothetical protein
LSASAGSAVAGSNHYLSAFVLSGKTEYSLIIEDCQKRGKELPEILLDKTQALMGKNFPQASF